MSAHDILVVAGEASGDQHAAGVVAALKRHRPELHFFGMGGTRLAAEYVDLIYGAHELGVMGITEVVPKLRRILQVLEGLSRAAARRRPGCALLVDVPDFNLRLAERLKGLGIPVAYYVSPMVWAWREGRVKQIARTVDRMLCILPFEEGFYRQRGVLAQYVGHPVLEQLPAPSAPAEFRRRLGLAEDATTLALLPGSRGSELSRILPSMVQAAVRLLAERPALQVVVPVAPSVSLARVAAAFTATPVRPVLVEGRAPEVVGASDVAVVASGTATLEAALMGRPTVVVYRVSPISYWVGRALLDVPFISLPNLLLQQEALPELIQSEMNPKRIAAEVSRLLDDASDRERRLALLARLRATLGSRPASELAAESILSLL